MPLRHTHRVTAERSPHVAHASVLFLDYGPVCDRAPGLDGPGRVLGRDEGSGTGLHGEREKLVQLTLLFFRRLARALSTPSCEHPLPGLPRRDSNWKT